MTERDYIENLKSWLLIANGVLASIYIMLFSYFHSLEPDIARRQTKESNLPKITGELNPRIRPVKSLENR
jgi:hypothetical protein